MVGYSDNTIAEMIFKEVGVRSGLGSDRASAAAAVVDVLEEMGLHNDALAVFDGSGLSTHNRLTCDLVRALLLQAGSGSALESSLSVVGESGTLRLCTVNDPSAYGNVLVKTGLLNDAVALAGVTTARNEERIVFAMMANGPVVGIALGSCNTMQRHLITTTRGHPYN